MRLKLFRRAITGVILTLLCAATPASIFAQTTCATAVALTVNACSAPQSMNGLSTSTAPASSCTSGNIYALWYKFTAPTANPTITVSNLGAGLSPTTTYVEVLTGACGTAAKVCQNVSTPLNLSGLTVGNTYEVLVYTTAAPTSTSTFTICLQDNTTCANAFTLAANSCSVIQSMNGLSTSTAPAGSCTAGNVYALWYKFSATASNQTLTVGNLGAGLTTANTYVELLSGACGTSASVCQNVSTPLNMSGLTVGTTYQVLVYTTAVPAATSTFTLCLQDNTTCANALTLSANSCSGSQSMASVSAGTAPAGSCTAGSVYALWYSFAATSTNPTITVGNLGTGLSTASTYVEVLSGACGTAASVCQNISGPLTLSGLTVGNTYTVLVYSTAAPSATSTFTICVQDPPANDDASGAVALATPGTTCSSTAGTMYAATPSTGLPTGCESTGEHYDEWYKFTPSVSGVHVVALTISGTNFTQPELQLYTGAPASLTSVDCGTTSLTDVLTAGTTYYVRVSNVGSAPIGTGTLANFSLCVTTPTAPTNDDPAAAASITPGASCSTISGTLMGATVTSGVPAGCASTGSHYDVWYKFTAAATTTDLITLSGLGANITDPELQLYSGPTAASLTSVACGSNTTLAAQVVSGTTYWIRVSNVGINPSGSSSAFSICVTTNTAPGNDDPSTATGLTAGASCSTTATNMNGATPTSNITVGCEAATSGSTHYDVWFKFTPNATSQVITVSSVTAGIVAPEIELYSGTPGVGAAGLTPIACGGTATAANTYSLYANGLSTSATYYIRLSSVGSNPTLGTNTFKICVTSAGATQTNDDPAAASTLTPAAASTGYCSNTKANMANASATPSLPVGCESAGSHYDVWFKFTANATTSIVTISNLGSEISNPEIQLYSGAAAPTASLACGKTSVSATTVSGTLYWIRVSNVGSRPTGASSLFNICVYSTAAVLDYSRNYVNITKGSTGGTVDPGDTLEMRAVFVVRNNAVDNLQYLDTLYHGAGLAYVPNSLVMRTNEGIVYKSYTDAAGDDPGVVTTSLLNPSDTVIRMNFGVGASDNSGGLLSFSTRPVVYSSPCIVIATYRVVVYAPYNTKINFRTGSLNYHDPTNGVTSTKITFPNDSLIVYQSPGLCPNAVSASNILGAESNGTFGTSAGAPPLARNRGTTTTTTYTYGMFLPVNSGGPQDYQYGIANNTSQVFSTVTTWNKPDNSVSPGHRVFNLWDVMGDHTGSSNGLGNPPCDTTKPVSSTNPCGYMLVINSAYKADTAFTYTIMNLCSNTNYEISAWFKNMCSKCGCDSTGAGATSAGYIVSVPGSGDSSGVKPNIAFDVNGVDYYTTGNITYGGPSRGITDAANQWVKRGFTYQTGANQTSFTLTLRNNAPGGGGNDWALDDIGVKTCLPNMQYSPTVNPATCRSNMVQVNDTVRSYFNSFQYYKWQNSTDNGNTWNDISGASGTSAPTWNGSAYEFITGYTIPPSATQASNNNNMYRVMVATTNANLFSSNCQVTDGVSQIKLTVNNCGFALDVKLISFNGKLVNHFANLQWSTNNENVPVRFEIERSTDQTHFTYLQTVNGKHEPNVINYYALTDSMQVKGTVWYRIAMVDQRGNRTYSSVIALEDAFSKFDVTNVINPFDNTLQFQVNISDNAKLDLSLLTLDGSTIRKMSIRASSGVNSYSIPSLNALAKGVYLLQVTYKDASIIRKIVKN